MSLAPLTASAPRRIIVGGLGLIAATVFAALPATESRTTHEWTSESAHSRVDLMVLAEPDALAAVVPRPPAGAESTLGTGPGELFLHSTATSLTVRAVGTTVFDVNWPEQASRIELTIVDDRWTLTDPDGAALATATHPAPRVSELSATIGSTEPISVQVVTQPHGLSPTALKMAAGLIALLAAAWLGLASTDRAESTRPSRRRLHLDWFDGVIAVAILGWLVLGPAVYDDGWSLARQRGYSDLGRFSGYFTGQGATVALGYWTDWLMQWWTNRVTAIWLLRLPIAAIGFGTWLLVRHTFRLLTPASTQTKAVHAVLGTAFFLGYTAWLQTLRPEPLIAILTAMSLAFVVSFQRSGATRELWWAGVAAMASIAVHPAGVVALAPVLAVLPDVWRSLGNGTRALIQQALGVLVALGSLGLILLTFDSDIAHRLSDARTVNASGSHPFTWADELERYRLFGEFLWATPVRRLFAGLAAISVLSWLVRPRSNQRLPGAALLIGLALLALTPSKWPWHLGGLTAILAVALTVEVITWAQEGTRPSRIAAATVALPIVLGWAWSISDGWAHIDLVSLEWTAGATNVIPASLGNPIVWLTAMGGALIAGRYIGHRIESRSRLLRDLLIWSVAGSITFTVGFAAATFAQDTRVTTGWTFSDQIIGEITGRYECGLGDQLMTPTPGSVIALPTASVENSDAADDVAASAGYASEGEFVLGKLQDLAPPPVPGIQGFGWLPATVTGTSSVEGFRSAWYTVDSSRALGLFVLGEADASSRIAVQYGTLAGDTIESLQVQEVRIVGVPGWRHIQLDPPHETSTMRVLGDQTAAARGGWLAVTAPVTYDTQPLGSTAVDLASVLVTPELALYLPCIDQPKLTTGVAEVPEAAVVLVPLQTTWLDSFERMPDVRTYVTVDHAYSDRLHIQMSARLLTGNPPTLQGLLTTG